MLGRGLQIRKMFDCFTRSKFYTRCKSLLKMTKTRLEASRKKKITVANYLKNDIALLLRTGFHSNAYSRTQGLIFEHNLIAAYKFLEHFCDCISTNLAVLDKQKECTKECREAIQSLMHAAARLAEFPELRDLRSLFAHRYGDCLDLYINKEFGELLNPKLATKEIKLQLLRDVAQEFSINWDTKFLEHKLFRPRQSIHQNQNRNGGSNNAEDGEHKTTKSKDDVAAALGSKNISGRRFKYKLEEDGKRESHETKLLGTSEVEVASPRRKNVSNEKHRLIHSSSWSESTDRDSSQPSPSSMGTTSSASKDEVVDNIKIPYRFVPPPYVRTRLDKQDQGSPNSSSPDTVESGSTESQPKPRSVRTRQQMKAMTGDENAGSVGSPLKPPPGRAYFGSFDSGSGIIFGRSNKGSVWEGSDDEEEQHSENRVQHERQIISKVKPLAWRSRDEPGSAPPFASNGGTTRHARSLSAESEVSGHVHSNLPDYDSLAARIAAFMGKS